MATYAKNACEASCRIRTILLDCVRGWVCVTLCSCLITLELDLWWCSKHIDIQENEEYCITNKHLKENLYVISVFLIFHGVFMLTGFWDGNTWSGNWFTALWSVFAVVQTSKWSIGYLFILVSTRTRCSVQFTTKTEPNETWQPTRSTTVTQFIVPTRVEKHQEQI